MRSPVFNSCTYTYIQKTVKKRELKQQVFLSFINNCTYIYVQCTHKKKEKKRTSLSLLFYTMYLQWCTKYRSKKERSERRQNRVFLLIFIILSHLLFLIWLCRVCFVLLFENHDKYVAWTSEDRNNKDCSASYSSFCLFRSSAYDLLRQTVSSLNCF